MEKDRRMQNNERIYLRLLEPVSHRLMSETGHRGRTGKVAVRDRVIKVPQPRRRYRHQEVRNKQCVGILTQQNFIRTGNF